MEKGFLKRSLILIIVFMIARMVRVYMDDGMNGVTHDMYGSFMKLNEYIMNTTYVKTKLNEMKFNHKRTMMLNFWMVYAKGKSPKLDDLVSYAKLTHFPFFYQASSVMDCQTFVKNKENGYKTHDYYGLIFWDMYMENRKQEFNLLKHKKMLKALNLSKEFKIKYIHAKPDMFIVANSYDGFSINGTLSILYQYYASYAINNENINNGYKWRTCIHAEDNNRAEDGIFKTQYFCYKKSLSKILKKGREYQMRKFGKSDTF